MNLTVHMKIHVYCPPVIIWYILLVLGWNTLCLQNDLNSVCQTQHSPTNILQEIFECTSIILPYHSDQLSGGIKGYKLTKAHWGVMQRSG